MPLSHLYRLGSWLIKVGVCFCDVEDSAIQSLLGSGLDLVVSSFSSRECQAAFLRIRCGRT